MKAFFQRLLVYAAFVIVLACLFSLFGCGHQPPGGDLWKAVQVVEQNHD